MITEPVPIRRHKLSDDVQERVLSLIRREALRPGDVLPSERELMTSYRVGRPAVREAMQNLQRMGLVEIRHGERPRVAHPSMEAMVGNMAESVRHVLTHSEATLRHLREARHRFETEMARDAARRRTPEHIERLEAILADQEAALSDPARFLDLDGAFHRAVAAIGGNPIFESVSQALFEWLIQFHVDMVRLPGQERFALREHRAVLKAIAAGKPNQAAERMADHLNRVNRPVASAGE
jgi:GntR family transcriptional regulator, sialic acid-inducible nan operon repressor